MDIYESTLEAAECGLEDIMKNGVFKSAEDVHVAYELVGIARRIHAIWAYEEPQAEEGSMFGHNSRRNSYDNGASYRMGSSRRMSRNNGGSYRSSYHDEKSFVDKMQKMRDEAPDEQTRMEIDRLLSQMGQ